MTGVRWCWGAAGAGGLLVPGDGPATMSAASGAYPRYILGTSWDAQAFWEK